MEYGQDCTCWSWVESSLIKDTTRSEAFNWLFLLDQNSVWWQASLNQYLTGSQGIEAQAMHMWENPSSVHRPRSAGHFAHSMGHSPLLLRKVPASQGTHSKQQW